MPLIDLSAPIEPSSPELPEPLRVEIEYADHAAGAQLIETLFGVPPRLLRDGEGWANDEFRRLGTHNSTHVDAPWHYNSTIRGEPAKRIDELPLEWFFADAVKLSMLRRDDGEAVTAADVEAELKRIGHRLKPLEIVVVNTRAGSAYGTPDYVAAGAGMGREATLYLLEQGVRVTGTDAWSWDAPFVHTKEKFIKSGDASLIWEGHKAGRDIGYCHLEKLHNLEALPADGFTMACFPVKIRGASAGWTRAVAILDG